jgi:hypothetical protein
LTAGAWMDTNRIEPAKRRDPVRQPELEAPMRPITGNSPGLITEIPQL